MNRLLDKAILKVPLQIKKTALDIGCGSGEDAVSLAKRGFSVTALDISSQAVHDTTQKSKIDDVKIDALKTDITHQELSQDYDLILCNNMLHFIPADNISNTLQKIKRHTNTGGINIITAFTEKSPIEYGTYKFRENELKEYYPDWKIIYYIESPEGTVELMAQKTKSQ